MFSSTNVGCSGQSEWELLSVTQSSKLGSEEGVSFKKILREVQKRQDETVRQAEARAAELQRRLRGGNGRGSQSNSKPSLPSREVHPGRWGRKICS